jgi:uncharacterized protein (TIGR00369 family)
MNAPEALTRLFAEAFPQAMGVGFVVESVDDDASVVIRLDTGREHLRPGDVVSGPTVMTLADTAMYASLIARLGTAAIPSVTSSVEVHFLAKIRQGPVRARCRLLKVGRRLAVGTVTFWADDPAAVLAHATLTYAMP